jgi:hypothetical protein
MVQGVQGSSPTESGGRGDRVGGKDMTGSIDDRRTRTVAIVAIGAWFAAALLAGVLGLVNQPGRSAAVLLGLIVVPTAGFVAAYLLSPRFRAFAGGLPLTLLVGSHLWRFVGVGFVIGWVVGALPGGFGIPEGVGDVIAALGALLLLPGLLEGRAPRGWLLAWNTFGLVDLVSAIAVGLLYSESALGVLSPGTPTTRLMVTFPVSLIPTFFVPLFILLHVLTFKRIGDVAAPQSP